MASCAITITRHAIDRYRQRVADLPEREICEQLASRMVERAAIFGAPFVKLPGKQRLVLRGFTVVTVLLRDHAPAALDRRRTH